MRQICEFFDNGSLNEWMKNTKDIRIEKITPLISERDRIIYAVEYVVACHGHVINIQLSDTAKVELDALRTKLDSSSISEVIRSSVALMKFLEAEKEQGGEIIIRFKDGTEKHVVMR